MTVLQHNPFLIASGNPTDPTFPVQRSVRLRSSASAYFNRTPASASNRQTWTWSAWVKRGTLGVTGMLFSTPYASAGNNSTYIQFAGDILVFTSATSSTDQIALQTSQVFRDPSAWYHIVVVADTTNATSTERARIYINGVRVTAFSVATYPAQNTNTYVNTATIHQIGRIVVDGSSFSQYFDGYLEEINFIDGQALTPIAFGGYNPGTGVWEPRKYTGTYGTNGFYLNFQDNSAATATTIGKDSSGNGNNWTPNNISVTAGVTYDSMLDVPTNTGGNNANFCTFNPIFPVTSTTFADGNLRFVKTGTVDNQVYGTIAASSGKYAWECVLSNINSSSDFNFGVIKAANATGTWSGTYAAYFGGSGNVYRYGTNIATGVSGLTFASGSVIRIELDMDAGTLQIFINNVSIYTITGLDTTAPHLPMFNAYFNNEMVTVNFGQRPFTNSPTAGFKSLNTYNLPDPAITQPVSVHNLYTYTGNGGGLQVGEIQKPMSLYNLDRSLRFKAATSGVLSRTYSTGANAQKVVFSAWVKRGTLGVARDLLAADSGTAWYSSFLQFTAADQLRCWTYYGAIGTRYGWITTRVFKDPSAWIHIHLIVDTSIAGQQSRRLFIDGVEELAFTAEASGYNSVGMNHYIFATGAHSIFSSMDGYAADVYGICGQTLLPSAFGQYDGNYYWTPKAYTGTYAASDFHLEFEDFSAATAAAIGKDTSGNSNNWTPTGINVTAPANTNVDWDSMVDVPTLTSTDSANFCTLNPLLVAGGTTTYSKGNLNTSTAFATTYGKPLGTIPISAGKWYWETTIIAVGGAAAVGIGDGSAPSTTTGLGGAAGEYTYTSAAQKYNNNVLTSYGATYTTNDIIGIAYDADVGTIEFYKNGTSQGVAFTGINGIKYAGVSATGPTACQYALNFGQRPFRYTVPTGFKSLNSFNVAEVLGDVESPDFVWIKSRSATGDNALFNSVTGVGKYLRTSNAVAEVTDVNSLIQFNKNGFLLGNAAISNAAATTFIASAWKMAATTATNNAGTVTSQVRANQTAGVSIATFTAAASGNFTVGHGLGVAPAMVILKTRAATDSFYVYNKNFATPATYYLQLNSTSVILSSASLWGSTLPTSSVITLGTGGGIAANATGILYSFADVEGFSKFGVYTSNNDPNGPFVYTGFRPRWLMVKRAMVTAGATGGWFMYDAARNTYNVMDKYLFAEGTAGENTLAVFDFTANGFKIRSNNVHVNTTAGNTYIYMAFAENPFKYSLAR